MGIDGEVVGGVRECMCQTGGVWYGRESVDPKKFFLPSLPSSSTKYIQNVVVSPKTVCMYNRI
jgi:hypothetical protein